VLLGLEANTVFTDGEVKIEDFAVIVME